MSSIDADLTPPIEFYLHELGEAEQDAISLAMRDPLLTTGPRVERFEAAYAEMLGARHCVGLSSCTAALHLALEALDIGAGDEVIVPAMTFAATALAVLHTGATPVLVDVDRRSGLIDLECAERAINKRTRAIIPVHLFGQMVDMPALASIAARHGLAVIEDAAHCIEGVHQGVRPGTLSDAACFSFFATKNMTSGEGGALVTNVDVLASRVRLARNHGMNKVSADRIRDGYSPWDIERIGWKYNMNDLQAAMLMPQIPRVTANLASRSRLATLYDEHFRDHDRILTPPRSAEVHALHLYTVQVPAGLRGECMGMLKSRRIGFTVNYRCTSRITAFRELPTVPAGVPVSADFGERTLSLPLYPSLPEADVHQVAETVKAALK